jgi:hypothetical protein
MLEVMPEASSAICSRAPDDGFGDGHPMSTTRRMSPTVSSDGDRLKRIDVAMAHSARNTTRHAAHSARGHRHG